MTFGRKSDSTVRMPPLFLNCPRAGMAEGLKVATLLEVVNHYDTQFNLQLSDTNKKDLIEYLKGI
jgi:hypothetical protein